MNEEFAQRVRSAAIAGWWTLLIAAAVITVQWLAYLAVMSAKPACVLALWGPDITWPTVQSTWLWGVAVLKMVFWVAALLVIWLSLWARRLRRMSSAGKKP